MTDRYDGKPFQRLLDAYVLDVIGALDPRTDQQLTADLPRLTEALGSDAATWQALVREQMRFSPDEDERIRASWAKAKEADEIAGRSPDPTSFALALGDLLAGDKPG